jgi:glutamate N-acetyltransferase / amino-acid N-acetyltransferase
MAEIPLVPSSAIPKGFRFAAVRAGIKASGRLDLGYIVADIPATAAAMFTSNQVVAAPVMIGRDHLASTQGQVRGVLVNAGNANCATGHAGIEACRRVCAAAAADLACSPEEIFPSSTGIIGVPLPADRLVAALPSLKTSLGNSLDHFTQFATAIMTTDTRAKAAYASIVVEGVTVRLLGTTKGAGMIQPKLADTPHATMLAYLLTDATVDVATLDAALYTAAEQSFNRISIDGDTSTNDTVLLLASGGSGASLTSGAHREAFQQALNEVCQSLAKQMVADGEGVGHVVELNVQGAHSDRDALQIARSIANSPLVKTAWAGTDPNWGRILAAVGNAGVAIESGKISVHFGNLEICRDGGVSPSFDEAQAHAYLEQPEFSITIDLKLGDGKCRFWTCDLTSEYVKINADYST